jgi:hypothetical protein
MPLNSNSALESSSYVIKDIMKDFLPFAKKNFYFVNSLREERQESAKVDFIKRHEDAGTLSVTSRGQNSPIIEQGTYQKYSAAALEIKAAKVFKEEDINNLLSTDKTNRRMAIQHIRDEQEDLLRKGIVTQELMAWSAFSRGEIKYSQYNPMAGVHFNPVTLSYPVQTRTKTDGAWWGEATQTSVIARDDIDNAIDEFRAVAGNPPSEIWMTNQTLKTLRNTTQVSTAITNWYRSQNIGDVTPNNEQVAKAFNWPAIRIYDQSFLIEMTARATASSGSAVAVSITQSIASNTFGLSIGDIVYIGTNKDFLNGTYREKDVIVAIDHGNTITLRTLDNNIAVGDKIWARPTFMANDSIILVDTSVENMIWGLAPFGINDDGTGARWYGWQTQPFQMGEPNLATYYRVWNSLIPIMFSPKRIMKFKVRDLVEEYAAGKIGG